jgi:hypothetical protein
MQGKPIISIDKFSGSGAGGIWYNNGLVAHKENGQSMLMEDFKQESVFTKASTGFSNLEQPRAAAYLKLWAYGGGSLDYMLLMDYDGYMYTSDFDTGKIKGGEILAVFGDRSYRPDFALLPSGNLIFSQSTYLGKLIRGACHSDSTTGKIVDKDGRNFETLGVVTGEEVTNLFTGTTYTITGIANENATKDALTFDAGATANAEFAEFMTFDYNAFDLNSGITIPTFRGQDQNPSNWARQIMPFDDYWFILNGNYLAILDSDESTFDNNYKQLPYGHQALAIATNGVKIVVMSKTVDGSGYLLLWDGYSDGWLNIKKLGGVANAVQTYENGFVYITNGKLFYSDGYNDTLLGEYNDTNDACSSLANIVPASFNSLLVSNGMVFCVSTANDFNRVFPGVYYWSKDYGWGYMPTLDGTRSSWGGKAGEEVAECIYKNDFYKRLDVLYTNGMNKITDNGGTTNTLESKSFVYAVSLPQNQQIKEIGLNIGFNPKYYSYSSIDTQCKISVNIGDGRSGLTKYFSTLNVTGTTSVANTLGATRAGYVGKEVLFVSGAMSGERTYITSIANAGTANEVWTVSPALSTNANTVAAIQYMVDQTETRTISINDINKEQRFSLKKECLGNKLIIEVVIHGVATSFPVAIQGVNIYG